MKRLVKIISVALAAAIIASLAAVSASAKTYNLKGWFNYSYARKVLKLVNKARAKRGSSKVKLDSAMTKTAMMRAAELSIKFSHDRPNGTSCANVFKWNRAFGENIAYNDRTPADVMRGWTRSTYHNKNILDNDFKIMGVGCYCDSSGGIYWVQAFSGGSGKKCSTSGTQAVDIKISTKKNSKTTVKVIKNAPVIKSAKLKTASVKYDGKAHTCKVIVKDTKGRTVPSKFYTVTCDKTHPKKVGAYSVYVNSNYSSKQFILTYKITPPTPELSLKEATSDSLTVSWKKLAGAPEYYVVQYADNAKFKDASSWFAYDNSYVIDWLDSDTDYYVRIRARYSSPYGDVDSAWSKTVKARTIG